MLSADEAQAYMTSDELTGLRDIVAGGMADYDDPANYSPAARLAHTKSVAAQIRNAHMAYRAQKFAVGSERTRYTPVRQKPLLAVGDRLSVSFRKLDRNHRPRVGRTRQSKAFMAQIPLPIAMPPETTNIVAGYVLDRFDAGYEMVLTCPGPIENYWELPFHNQEPSSFFADAPRPEADATSARRVKVRTSERKTGSTDESKEAGSSEAAQ